MRPSFLMRVRVRVSCAQIHSECACDAVCVRAHWGILEIPGMRAKEVIKLVIASKKRADEDGESLRLVFRDPLIFKEKLLNSEVGDVVATQV